MSYELLLFLVEMYEQKVGDNKAKDFWNWIVDNVKPDRFEKLNNEQNLENN